MKVRDLINVGIFSVLLFVVTFSVGMLGLIPIMMVFMPFLLGLITGPVFMLYSTKINKMGMFFITCVIFALVFGLTGHGIYTIIALLIIGFIGELIMKVDYNSIKRAIITHVIFMLYSFTNFLPILLNREEYFKNMLELGYKQEYIDAFSSYVQPWAVLPVCFGACLGSFIGCIIGVKMLKKHFEKANMV